MRNYGNVLVKNVGDSRSTCITTHKYNYNQTPLMFFYEQGVLTKKLLSSDI